MKSLPRSRRRGLVWLAVVLSLGLAGGLTPLA